jgi:hypothetical protein
MITILVLQRKKIMAIQQLQAQIFAAGTQVSDEQLLPYVEAAWEIAREAKHFIGVLSSAQEEDFCSTVLQPALFMIQAASAEDVDIAALPSLLQAMEEGKERLTDVLQLTDEQTDQIQSNANSGLLGGLISAFGIANSTPQLWDGVSEPPKQGAILTWLKESTLFGAFLQGFELSTYQARNTGEMWEQLDGDAVVSLAAQYANAGLKTVKAPIVQYWNQYWEQQLAEASEEMLQAFASLRDVETFSKLLEIVRSLGDAEEKHLLHRYAQNVVEETFSATLMALADLECVTNEAMLALVRFHITPPDQVDAQAVYRKCVELALLLPENPSFDDVQEWHEDVIHATTPFLDDAEAATNLLVEQLLDQGIICGDGGKSRVKALVKEQLGFTRRERISWNGDNTVAQVAMLCGRYALDQPVPDTYASWLADATHLALEEATKLSTFAEWTGFIDMVFADNSTRTALYNFIYNHLTKAGMKLASEAYVACYNAL